MSEGRVTNLIVTLQYSSSLCHKPVGDLMQAVDELLRLLGASAEDPVPRPTWHYDDGKLPQLDNSMPLREALAMCYDLRCALMSAHAVLPCTLNPRPTIHACHRHEACMPC